MLGLESLSLRNPQPIPEMPCTVLQQKIEKVLGPNSRKVSSLSQISAEILLKSEIFVSAEILLKLRFTKGISAETKISATVLSLDQLKLM